MSSTTSAAFLATFKELVGLVERTLPAGVPQSIRNRVVKLCEYTVLGGKLNRGLSVVEALRDLSSDALSEAALREAEMVGWAIEWLQGSFLVADDIVDGSATRRGKPCWYKLDGVGLSGLNDAFFLESSVYTIIDGCFSDSDSSDAISGSGSGSGSGSAEKKLKLMKLFHDVTRTTVVGQMLDLELEISGKGSGGSGSGGGGLDLHGNRFTWDVYTQIVRNKTAYYSFYLPIASSLILYGADESWFKDAEAVLIPMGEYFQAQDDFLDVFGAAETTGKIGTDIEDGKCSWLVCKALEILSVPGDDTEILRAKLLENYGRAAAASKRAVLEVYEHEKVDLKARFAEYESDMIQSLEAGIEALMRTERRKLAVAMSKLLDRIRGREK